VAKNFTTNKEALKPEISASYDKYFDRLSMTTVHSIVLSGENPKVQL
jgi:hypothetical protein